MAESIDAPNQEPVVTSPMKYPLYHELHMANSAGTMGNNSELSPETHQLPERIQDLNLNGTLEKQTTAADTPILNSNCHINPELGGLPTGNIVYQPVNMRQKGRQNINENSNYPAAAGFNQSNMNSQSGHVRGHTRNNLNNSIGQPRFEYSEENQQNDYHERNFNENEHSEHYQQQQRYNRMRYSEYPDHLINQSQYHYQQNQTRQVQGNWNNQQIPGKRCEVCEGDHEITLCNQNNEVVARVCIKIGICPKCRTGGHPVTGCPLLYLEKEQARMNTEKNHEESRNRSQFNDQESNQDNRNSTHQNRANNQPRYAERKNEILERELARHVATIKPFTGVVSEYASFRNIVTDYLDSETVSLAVRRDTLMQKISGEAAVHKSILNDPGKAIEATMKNLDRTYNRKGSTSVRNQFEKVVVSDESIDTFIKSLALSRSLHDKVLEEEPHGFEYHSTKALLGRMPDAVRAMCNKMLRNETLTTEKIYEKAEEHLENQIEDAEITGRSASQSLKKWKTELHVTQSETDHKEEADKDSEDESTAELLAFGAKREQSKFHVSKALNSQQGRSNQTVNNDVTALKSNQKQSTQQPAQSQNQPNIGTQAPYLSNMLPQSQFPQPHQTNNQLGSYQHQFAQYPYQMNSNHAQFQGHVPAPMSSSPWNPQPSHINYYLHPTGQHQNFTNQQHNGQTGNLNQSQDPRNQLGYHPVPQHNNSPASFGQSQQRSSSKPWFKENGSPPSVGHSTGIQLSIQEEAMKPLTDCRDPDRYNLGPGPNIALIRYTFPRDYDEESYCQVCGKGHKLVRCLLSSSNVRKWIDEKNACSNCASRTHSVTACNSQVSCFYCCGKHHTGACKLKEAYRDFRNYPPTAVKPSGIDFFRDQQH